MAKNKFYFDTSIWIDYYLERGENGDSAIRLIFKIIAEDSKIILSNFVKKELKNVGFSQKEINWLIKILKPDYVKFVHVTRKQFEEAQKISKQRNISLGDTIHAILARDNEAQLVSRDWDFERLKDIAKAKKPEDLL